MNATHVADHTEVHMGKWMFVTCLKKTFCVIKERPGRAVKGWRRHCNPSIWGMSGQRLHACSTFVKLSWWLLIKHHNTCSKSVLWMGGKKAEFPVSVCQLLRMYLFSMKKKQQKTQTHTVGNLECIFRKWKDFSGQKHTWWAIQASYLCVQVWWHLSPVPFGFQTFTLPRSHN